MKIRYLLGLVVLGAVGNAACGDDNSENPGPGSGGSGGAGGSTTSSTSSGQISGTGGQGGGGSDGSGGTGGNSGPGGSGGTGGGSLPGGGADGTPCTADDDCAGAFCYKEADTGFPTGFCSGDCDLAAPVCAGGGVCIDVGLDAGVCVVSCDGDIDCRAGYACQPYDDTTSLCSPACTSNSQCPVVGVCDTSEGLCQPTETNCADGLDDDGDGDIDCVDANCASICEPLVNAACAGALTATTGNTTTGTTAITGSCFSSPGKAAVHTFTQGAAGEEGVLTVTLSSATDQGLFGRSTCNDEATELGCGDTPSAGGTEVLQFPVNGAEPVSIFVAASEAGEEGPYSLSSSYVTFDAFCAANAATAVLGANAGDTTDGSVLFAGTICDTGNPGTREQIYQFVPAATGRLSLELASDADLGVYVRTSCAPSGDEIGCEDTQVGGEEETLEVPVTGGTPVFIVVDGYTAGDFGPFTLTLSFM